jgi:stearoyl-CoA desaturase (Delta-9 desaturase)
MTQTAHTASIATVRERTGLASQVVTLLAVAVPPIGLLSAMGLLWDVAFHWVDLVLLVVLYVLTALGNSVGFHRYFTHKGFETGPIVKAALAILGCMAM